MQVSDEQGWDDYCSPGDEDDAGASSSARVDVLQEEDDVSISNKCWKF